MAENSKIEWCDHTFNPWIGCMKVSDGCKHCYAEQLMDKRYKRVEWGPTGRRVRTSAANWRKPTQWNKKRWWHCLWCGWRGDDSALAEPNDEMLLEPKTPCPSCNRWQLEPARARVFCASLADIFEEKPDQPELDDWRRDLFQMIINTPHLDWLLLTKRPENVCHMIERVTGFSDALMWFPKNVWVGTSVENQEAYDKRAPELAKVPAAVRFLSMEPLLGPVNLFDVDGKVSLAIQEFAPLCYPADVFDLVIVGGESGHDARPMHPDWARSLRDQCGQAGVPFFFKQWGEWVPWIPAKGNPKNLPIQHVMQNGSKYYPGNFTSPLSSMIKVGKHAAGRQLDGVEWNHSPALDHNGQSMA